MKEHKKIIIFEIILVVSVLIIILTGIVLSILSVLNKGFASYGGIILGAIALALITGGIALLTKSHSPKSKFGKFMAGLTGDLAEGIFQLLSFAG